MRDETIVTVINKSDDQGGNRPKKEACLVVIYGAELGRKYHIDGREMTIGRGTLNDICVSQDSVSRTHAMLRVEDAGIKIRDNESTNGTYVNDHKIHEAYLKDGDLIKVGRSIFKFLTGDNIDLFPCIATVGVQDGRCLWYEQPLNAGYMALDPGGEQAEQAKPETDPLHPGKVLP